METIIALIIEYASVWAPALCAILGIGVTVISALAKVKKSIDEFKKQDVMEELTNQLKEQNKENAELVHTNKLLLDNITKVHHYADIKKHEGEQSHEDNNKV